MANPQNMEPLYKALKGFERLGRPRGHVRPSAETAARTRAFLARFHEAIAAQIAGVHPQTLARCGAGLGMQGGILLAIEDVVHRDFEEFAPLEKVLSK